MRILTSRGQVDAAPAIAHTALESGLDDRWSSDQNFLRTIQDEAIRALPGIGRYDLRYKEFE